MGWFTDILENLDRPSNAFQGLVTGGWDDAGKGWDLENNYDFEDLWDEDLRNKTWDERKGFGETASYLGSTALNLVFDPLNLVGAGLFKKGAQAAGELKGALTTGNPNTIKDFYGPMASTEAKSKAIKENLIANGYSKKHAESQAAAVILEGKVSGAGGAVKEGLINAAKMQMPKYSSIYRDTGVNIPLFQTKKITDVNKSLNEEMIARAYGSNSNISRQADRVGDTGMLDDVTSRAAYTTYLPMKKGYYKTALPFIKGPKGSRVSAGEAAEIERHIGNVWETRTLRDKLKGVLFSGDDLMGTMGGGKAKYGTKIKDTDDSLFIVKRPESGAGGHWNDMHNTAQFRSIAEDVFPMSKDLPSTPAELLKRMQKVKYKTKNKKNEMVERTGLNDLKVDNDGVWFTFSKTGSALTEGGVNFRVKLKTNGKGFGVMSDEHNLIEGLPGVGRAVPHKLIAATPPMFFDIRKLKPAQSGWKKGRGRPTVSNKYENLGWKFGPDNLNVRDYMLGAKASPEMLRKEQLRAARKVIGGGMLGANNFSSDPQFRDSSFNWN